MFESHQRCPGALVARCFCEENCLWVWGQSGPQLCSPDARGPGASASLEAGVRGQSQVHGAPTVAGGALSADDTREPASRGPRQVPALRLGAAVPSGSGRVDTVPLLPGRALAGRAPQSPARRHPGLQRCGPACPEQVASRQFCPCLATGNSRPREPRSELFLSVCPDSALLLLVPGIRVAAWLSLLHL